mmetsp:Transcript_20212/g.60538  ORF Transcript_20212/g.60538 Transcript_20212/m.60538 type:complete len:354 (-) Transcript_20212:82-1143(-)
MQRLPVEQRRVGREEPVLRVVGQENGRGATAAAQVLQVRFWRASAAPPHNLLGAVAGEDGAEVWRDGFGEPAHAHPWRATQLEHLVPEQVRRALPREGAVDVAPPRERDRRRHAAVGGGREDSKASAIRDARRGDAGRVGVPVGGARLDRVEHAASVVHLQRARGGHFPLRLPPAPRDVHQHDVPRRRPLLLLERVLEHAQRPAVGHHDHRERGALSAPLLRDGDGRAEARAVSAHHREVLPPHRTPARPQVAQGDRLRQAHRSGVCLDRRHLHCLVEEAGDRRDYAERPAGSSLLHSLFDLLDAVGKLLEHLNLVEGDCLLGSLDAVVARAGPQAVGEGRCERERGEEQQRL